jgi:hypothetical protein
VGGGGGDKLRKETHRAEYTHHVDFFTIICTSPSYQCTTTYISNNPCVDLPKKYKEKERTDPMAEKRRQIFTNEFGGGILL